MLAELLLSLTTLTNSFSGEIKAPPRHFFRVHVSKDGIYSGYVEGKEHDSGRVEITNYSVTMLSRGGTIFYRLEKDGRKIDADGDGIPDPSYIHVFCSGMGESLLRLNRFDARFERNDCGIKNMGILQKYGAIGVSFVLKHGESPKK